MSEVPKCEHGFTMAGWHCPTCDPGPEGLAPPCKDCGKPEGSYACRIRKIQINTGWAKSAND